MKRSLFAILLLVLVIYTVISCKPKSDNNTATPSDGNYPPEIGNILLNKCATAGCHNAASHAADLVLDSWEHLFQGDGQGAVVIPYSTKYSLLLYRVNTDSSLGLVIPPFQPPTISTTNPSTPLSKTEYLALSNWIAKGAPDKFGNIPFASDPDTRQKIYITEQGCDLVSVVDAKSMLIMRYIPVGFPTGSDATVSPHTIGISADGMSAYVAFYAGPYFQRIDTRTDTVVETINIGSGVPGGGSWGIIITSPGADTAVMVTDFQQTNIEGGVAAIGTKPLRREAMYRGGLGMCSPHGIASNATWDTFFISGQYGNTIFKFFPAAIQLGNTAVKQISLDGNPPQCGSGPDPHEIQMVPDNSRYFVTCQATNEVRVMDAYTDTLIKVIPVGTFPQEMAMSNNPATPYIFVVCMLDNSPTYSNGNSGSIYVINYNTNQVVKEIYGDFARPHDLTVDDQDGLLFIPSTNADPNGPPAHHTTACGGRAGWYSVYKFGPNSFTPVNKNRYQTTVQPYSIGVRFGG